MITAKFENKGTYGIISVEGEVNILNNNEFKSIFNEAFNANQYKIIVNFSKTTYIDSSAISVIISSRNTIVSKNGIITFCCLPVTIEKVFGIIGFKGVVNFFKTLEEAVAYIESKK